MKKYLVRCPRCLEVQIWRPRSSIFRKQKKCPKCKKYFVVNGYRGKNKINRIIKMIP